MRLLKYIIVGAAVGYGINYIIKKGPDGRSILDDITDKVPDLFNKAKEYAGHKADQVKDYSQQYRKY